MRFWNLALLAFGAIASAAKYDSASLAKLVGPDGLIRLNDKTYDDVVSGPSDYTVAVLLTAAAPQFGCSFCKIIGPQFATLARSWHQDHPSGDGLFFAIADLPDNRAVYGKLGLTHAPNLWFYPASKTKHGPETGYDAYEFPPYETQIEGLVAYIHNTFGKTITVREPVDYSRLIGTVAGLVVSIAAFTAFRKQVMWALHSTKLWTALSLMCVLLFTSGHMFNVIRRTPQVGGGPGGIQYFVGGYSNQVAIETQIIAVMYAVMAFTVIALLIRVPALGSSTAQTGVAAALSIVFVLALSFVVSAFRIKNGGYPFTLIPLF